MDAGSDQALRLAHVYDGRDDGGRPIAVREPLPGDLLDGILSYLESAPVVLAARSYDVDEFVPTERDVPLNFRTDGAWIWSGSVPHYLRKHGLPPEPELVRHIVDRGFRIGEVDEAAKDAAVRIITGE
ncbi:hypothetical protein AB0N05_21875 [Nocardia sp. NPDC051030]|uniref:hypothetical protein n=1 Tax=Nocardia sp. NPDC051030 TaxID=3155162 RepID=UPI003413B86C